MKEAWACKICFDDVMTPPIYQCSGGHTFCAICKDNLLLMNTPRCGQCRADLLTSSIRCLYAEQDMSNKNLFVECADCKEAVPFDNFLEHKPLCKPKIFSCDRCKKSGLTIEEYIQCMESHWAANRLIVRGDRFGIRHDPLNGPYDLMEFGQFMTALRSTSYTAPNSGCDDPASFWAWKQTHAARHGLAGLYGNTFTFDLQTAQNSRTSPSVQYGMNNGVMILLNDTKSHQDGKRYPPVLLRFFLYHTKTIDRLALTVKILGSESEIRRLKHIDNLCLCVKLGSEFTGPYTSETTETVRISGENLFKPEMSYSLRGFQGSFPDRLGLDQLSQTRYHECLEVIFRTQAYNGVYLNAGDSNAAR